jgi:hypothetical protein
MLIERRAFLRGLIAAPAVVAVASLMPVRLPLVLRPPIDVGALSLQMDAGLYAAWFEILRKSNEFLETINSQYIEQLQAGDLWTIQYGSQLRILPAAEWRSL